MKHAILMPALGETMDQGTIVSWRKSVGEPIAKGDVLLEVMTDKATFEVEATQQGFLRLIVCQVDDTAPVGKTLAWITDKLDEPFDIEEPNADLDERLPANQGSEGKPSEAPAAGVTPVRVSPRARRLLAQHGIPVETLAPRVPGRPIETSDVEAFLKTMQGDMADDSKAVEVESSRWIPLAGMRLTIARRMEQAAEVPQVTLHAHTVVDRLLQRHRRIKEHPRRDAVSLTDWIVKAVSTTLGSHPEMNCWFEPGGIRQFSHVNVGLAVDTPVGLVVVVIRHADVLTLEEIAEQRVDLRDRALSGRLRPVDLSGGTFTVSNLGGYGVETFSPLLNLPQVGILGVGSVAKTVVDDGTHFYSEQHMALSLTFDHRAVDGGPAARFLYEVGRQLMDPPDNWT